MEFNKNIITVFDDKDYFNATHPLTNKWVLWYDCPNKKITSQNWIENIKQIHTFNTLEEFWGIYNNILKPSSLSYGSNYYLFKNGIKPMWEDQHNQNGGKWSIQLKKNLDVDNIWLYTILNCLGEHFCDVENNMDFNSHITGIIVNIRKYQDKVNIWVNNKNDEKAITYIGQTIKQKIIKDIYTEIDEDDIKITYQDHS
jgi:translation initiation factor 4E